jgi:hypothetical protein
MPAVGFICPKDGSECLYAHCFTQCSVRCLPLPLLLSLARQRAVVPGQYSVTTILDPPKIVYYKRHYPYFEDPRQGIYAVFGTSAHALLEDGLAAAQERGLGLELESEKPFSVELETPAGKATLTGRPDLYDKTLRTLYDWKTMKAYSAKLLKEGKWDDSKFLPQLNIYRHFAYPEAEHLVLIALIKDHGRQTEIRDGLRPVEVIEVPAMDPKAVRDYTIYRLAENLRAEADPTKMRECCEDELWTQRDGMPMRCLDYCPAGKSGQCIQGSMLIEKYRKEVEHGKRKK